MRNAYSTQSLTQARVYIQKDIDETLILSSQDEAKELFSLSRSKLLNINSWHKRSGFLSPNFSLYNSDGIPVDRNAQKNDWVSTNAPGPQLDKSANWMLVQDIIYRTKGLNNEFLLLQLMTSYSPSEDIIHNLILSRDGDTVTMSYYNEREVRNNILLPSASINEEANNISWQKLIKAFLEVEE